jgi:hypothetical protein
VKLADYQRAVVELSFSVDDCTPPALPGFALYRQLIRARLFAMAAQAYRRSWALLGDPASSACFARFLAARPPRSPLIREVIGEFAAFAQQDPSVLAGAPPHARDLLSFEAAKWRVASAPARHRPGASAPLHGPESGGGGAVRDVDFDGVLVCNPTLERLALTYPVSEDPVPRLEAAPHTLLVYRRRGDDDVRWYRAPALLDELLALDRAEPGRALGEHVRTLFGRRPVSPGEAASLLEALAAALAVAVEREVLWGVRPA